MYQTDVQMHVKKGNHMYNLQQVKNSKAGYAKTPKVKLGLS